MSERALRPGLVPLDRDMVATFEVTRGSFTIPAELLEAEDDRELRRLFARSLPMRAGREVLETSRKRARDGSVLITWRHIVTRVRPAQTRPGPQRAAPSPRTGPWSVSI